MLWTPQDLAIVRDQVLRALVETGGGGTKFGTVNTVMPDRLRATVTLADATAASLVKVAGGCWCRPGDKVGLTRFGSEWYVTAVLNRVVGANFASTSVASTGGNTTSTTPVDMPGAPTFLFTKQWDLSPHLLGFWISQFHTVAAGDVGLHLAFVNAAGAATTYRVYGHGEGNAGIREALGGTRAIPDATYPTPLPAGQYTVRLRWSTAAGQVNQNTDDWSSASVLEGGL